MFIKTPKFTYYNSYRLADKKLVHSLNKKKLFSFLSLNYFFKMNSDPLDFNFESIQPPTHNEDDGGMEGVLEALLELHQLEARENTFKNYERDHTTINKAISLNERLQKQVLLQIEFIDKQLDSNAKTMVISYIYILCVCVYLQCENRQRLDILPMLRIDLVKDFIFIDRTIPKSIISIIVN